MDEAVKNLVVLVWTLSALNSEPVSVTSETSLIEEYYSQSAQKTVSLLAGETARRKTNKNILINLKDETNAG